MASLFVYGTLMDPDVAQAVIGRTQQQLNVEPASLDGYCALLVAGAPYPGLRKAPGETVRGMLLTGLTETEMHRLDEYEDLTVYRQEEIAVRDSAGYEVMAIIYMPTQRLRLTRTPWDLARWRRRSKAGYMARLS